MLTEPSFELCNMTRFFPIQIGNSLMQKNLERKEIILNIDFPCSSTWYITDMIDYIAKRNFP